MFSMHSLKRILLRFDQRFIMDHVNKMSALFGFEKVINSHYIRVVFMVISIQKMEDLSAYTDTHTTLTY